MTLPVGHSPGRLVVVDAAAVCNQQSDQGTPGNDATLGARLVDQPGTHEPHCIDIKLDRLESAVSPLGAVSSEGTDSSRGTSSGFGSCKACSSGEAHVGKGSAQRQREVMLRLAYISDHETKVRK